MRLVTLPIVLSAAVLAALTPAGAAQTPAARPDPGIQATGPAPATAGPAEAPAARIVRQSPDGFTLRVTLPEAERTPVELPGQGTFLRVSIPGFSPPLGEEEAGRPALPRHGYPFGLPDGATATVQARVLASRRFQGPPPVPVASHRFLAGNPPVQQDDYDPLESVYGSAALYPADLATLGPAGGWRHQRVQSVMLSPVQVNPATGTYTEATEVEITVDFVRAGRAPQAVDRVPAGVDAPGWDELIDRVLVNAASARGFRTRAASAPLPAATAEGETHMRIRLGESGLCRVSYQALADQGWPAGTPVKQVRVEERGYDERLADPFVTVNLPRTVEDGNGNGIFDAGDDILFYGLNYRDRFHAMFAEDRYTYFHAYWISADGDTGRSFQSLDGYPPGEYREVQSFRDEEHYEKDESYINNPPDAGSSFYPEKSSFYWVSAFEPDRTLPFEAYDPDPDGSFRIKALWQGVWTSLTQRDHYLSLDLNNCSLLTEYLNIAAATFVYDSGNHEMGNCLTNGPNYLRVRGHLASTNASTGAYFDWFDFSYDRLLKARGNRLLFNTGTETGNLEYAISGFTSPEVTFLEVTDPQNPRILEGRADPDGAGYTARLRVTATGTPRRFLAVVASSVTGLPASPNPLPPDLDDGAIAAGLPRDLLQAGAGSDYILITHPDFEDAWAPLVALRESQGHKVFVCNVWEIYDQFAGGDKTPRAIQRFLAQAYRTWNPAPSYVMLGGDASEDYRGSLPDSDPDFVPTMMHFAYVPGPGGKELAATDNWYVATLRPDDAPLDVFPEMHIGRISAGSTDEVNTIVQKIVDYESMDPGDAWRKRGFFMADDQYSTSVTLNTDYCYKPGEMKFRRTTEAMLDSIPELGGLTDFEAVPFFLDAYLDTVAALNRHPGDPSDCPGSAVQYQTSLYAREHVTPILLQLLSRGWLIWEYTGHANKNVMTTEYVLQHYPRSLTYNDLDRIHNVGKPFVFFGYACHLNEFEFAREGWTGGAGGDCMGEVMLFSPNAGAVATLASSGYELLETNPNAQIYTTRSLFWDLPRDPATHRPRRILGDCMTRAFVQNALENYGQAYAEMLRTYLTLGDPALVIDVQTPDFRVSVNGTEMPEGTPLVAGSFQDSLSVEVQVSDDVDVSSIRVLDGPTELSGDRITVIPPGADDEGVQTYTLRFKTALRLATYDLTVEATDWSGRTSKRVLPVRFETTFLRQPSCYAPGSTPEPQVMSQGGDNRLDASESILIRVSSPVPVTADAFSATVDGEAFAPQASATDETGRNWEVLVARLWEEGAHQIVLHTQGGEGSVDRTISFSVSTGTLDLHNVYFYPNPADGAGGGLYYELSRGARKAELAIYTVRGRQILRTRVDCNAGVNAYAWNIRDQVDDEVANGVYLFVLNLEGFDGETLRRLERVVVAR